MGAHTTEMGRDGHEDIRVRSGVQLIVSLKVIAISDRGASKSPGNGKLNDRRNWKIWIGSDMIGG